MAQHGLLVDRSLVGHLARVDRRRLVEQDRARDARRAAGARARERVERSRESRATAGCASIVARRSVGAPASARHVARFGKISAVTSSRSWPGDHDVLREIAELREQPRAQRADADPGAGRELEVLGEPSVESEALRRIVGIDEAQRVARAGRSPPRRTRRASVPDRASSPA